MKTQWTGAAILACALMAGCGDRQPDNAQNAEPGAALAPADTAASAEIGPAVDPPKSVPTPSPGRDSSRTAGTSSGFSGADTRPAPPRRDAAPAAPAPQFREITVPAGTALPLELLTPISSETTKVETPVRARLRQAVVIDDYTALPAGTILHGDVIDVERAGRVQGRSRLSLRFTEAELDGGREVLRTNPVSFEGEATKGEDATKIGAGAVGGAIIGGILGGGDGAAKGAAIGGAAGTGAVLATRGREVSLPAGTDIAATLASSFSVRAAQ